jgi:SAM-dependent methyltransferase
MKSGKNIKADSKNRNLDTSSEPEGLSTKNRFSDWNSVYAVRKVEDMPWYLPERDPDLKEALAEYQIESGSFLDIGTGPGTQAIALSEMGFEVTGVDISIDAIANAQKLTKHVTFLQDDILNSRINQKFNSIFDRGCFHIIPEDKRTVYISQVVKLLAGEGMLFLKCFSDKNPEMEFGPHHISREMIETLFGDQFEILEIKDSVYQSMSSHQKKTLFVVMKKKMIEDSSYKQ